jgi:hypothetical protein
MLEIVPDIAQSTHGIRNIFADIRNVLTRPHMVLGMFLLAFPATTYSHGNIYDWLKTILTDWTIIIPGGSCSEFVLSNWPATGFTRNGVNQWLEDKNHQKPDDLIDGACEPLAYYLSLSISQLNLSYY